MRRESAVDSKTATAAGLRSLSDEEVLTVAANEGRILVSHDRRTMRRAFAHFLRKNTSPGVLLISQKTDLLTAIEGIRLVWLNSELEEWVNQLVTIPF
jgi:predicted nuclease of predicted toxin-antitoxin system